MQLAVATFASMLYFVVQLTAKPYAFASDNWLALVCSLGLTLFFMIAMLFKHASLIEVDEIVTKMSDELEQMHAIDFPALLTCER